MTDPPGLPLDDPLRERVVDTRVIHRGRYMEFRTDTIERADGSRGTRDVVGHPGAVAIVALDDDGRVLLVRQWRVPAGEALLEIPAGTLDVHDGVTEDPLAAARRELEEETGYRAASWRQLTAFWTAPGFATERMYLFLARGIEAVTGDDRLAPDEDERLVLQQVPLDEALAMIERGEIHDAKSIVGILWLDRERRVGGVPGKPERAGDTPPGKPERAGDTPPGEPPYRVQYGFTAGQYAWANARWLRSQRGARLFGGAMLALALAAMVLGADPTVYLPSLVTGGLLLSGWFVIPFVLWGVRKRAALLADMSLDFDERGIRARWIIGATDLEWAGIETIRRSGPLLFIRVAASGTMLVPARAFGPGEYARFRGLALAHGLTLDGRRLDPVPA